MKNLNIWINKLGNEMVGYRRWGGGVLVMPYIKDMWAFNHLDANCTCVLFFFRRSRSTMIDFITGTPSEIVAIYDRFTDYKLNGWVCPNSSEFKTMNSFVSERARSYASRGSKEPVVNLELPTLTLSVCKKCIKEDLKAPNRLKDYGKQI